jgi:hypothetical protein
MSEAAARPDVSKTDALDAPSKMGAAAALGRPIRWLLLTYGGSFRFAIGRTPAAGRVGAGCGDRGDVGHRSRPAAVPAARLKVRSFEEDRDQTARELRHPQREERHNKIARELK